MKSIESIWNKSNLVKESDTKTLQNIYSQLESEEKNRKLYAIWPYIIVTFIMLAFLLLAYKTSPVFETRQITGVALVTIGSFMIVFFSQFVKVTISEPDYGKPSTEFLVLVKKKLNTRKNYLILGVTLQLISLISGLYLLIFATSIDGEMLGKYFGTMFSFSGIAMGIIIALYKLQYKKLIKRIDYILQTD
ncbi:MAG: hypothetical protein QM485_07080 [Flavobacteriaceae bacterium]